MVMGSLSPNIGIPCAFKRLHHAWPNLPCSICVGYDYASLKHPRHYSLGGELIIDSSILAS